MSDTEQIMNSNEEDDSLQGVDSKRRSIYDIILPEGFTAESSVKVLLEQSGSAALIHPLLRANLETFESISHLTEKEVIKYMRNFGSRKAKVLKGLMNQVGIDFLSSDERQASELGKLLKEKQIFYLATIGIHTLEGFLSVELKTEKYYHNVEFISQTKNQCRSMGIYDTPILFELDELIDADVPEAKELKHYADIAQKMISYLEESYNIHTIERLAEIQNYLKSEA